MRYGIFLGHKTFPQGWVVALLPTASLYDLDQTVVLWLSVIAKFGSHDVHSADGHADGVVAARYQCPSQLLSLLSPKATYYIFRDQLQCFWSQIKCFSLPTMKPCLAFLMH